HIQNLVLYLLFGTNHHSNQRNPHTYFTSSPQLSSRERERETDGTPTTIHGGATFMAGEGGVYGELVTKGDGWSRFGMLTAAIGSGSNGNRRWRYGMELL
ncbi:hypothetical protein M8C21_000602, partial [Ambrosia artemisiifolia]